MKLTRNMLSQMIREVLSEEDIMDKKIKYKDKEGNEKEATVGGILKQGEKHPGYKKAKQLTDKGKGEEKPKAKATKISADPFAKDDKEEKPSGDKPELSPEDAAYDVDKSYDEIDWKGEPDTDELWDLHTALEKESELTKGKSMNHERVGWIEQHIDNYEEAQAEGDTDKIARALAGIKYIADNRVTESITSHLKREFKEYNLYNKHMRKL